MNTSFSTRTDITWFDQRPSHPKRDYPYAHTAKFLAAAQLLWEEADQMVDANLAAGKWVNDPATIDAMQTEAANLERWAYQPIDAPYPHVCEWGLTNDTCNHIDCPCRLLATLRAQ